MGFYNVVNAPSMAAGQPEDVSQILANFNAIAAVLNGGIDSSNITDGSLVDADISAGAAIQLSKLAGAFTAYTPTWTTTGTAPALGNGVLLGEYIQVGKLVVCHIRLGPGTTTTFGTGNWLFSLPVTMISTRDYSGTGRAFDSSAAASYGLFAVSNGTTQIQVITSQTPGVSLTSAAPFTWASSDTMSVTYIYEAA